MSVTRKTFNFVTKHSLPFYFVSASEGTNVARVFNEAIRLAAEWEANPSTEEAQYFKDVMELLQDDTLGIVDKREAVAAG